MTAIAASVVTLLAWKVGVPVFEEFKSSFAMREFKEFGIYGTYKKHFFAFTDQLDDLARMDRENDELQQKVAHLEKKVTLNETRQAERELASLNEMLEERLRDDAGSELAIAMRTITYEIPNNLSYAQLYSLALGYFKKEDFEKSALLFHHLLELKEESKYRTAENYLLSGISWFKLHNFHLAARDIKDAKEGSRPSDSIHGSAILWEALVQKNLGKNRVSQEILLKYIETYPHTEESALVNGSGKMKDKKSEKNTEEHSEEHTERAPAREVTEGPSKPYSEKHDAVKADSDKTEAEHSATPAPHHSKEKSGHEPDSHEGHSHEK
jgi:tetratricopeptide (TPR) repeat protein